MDRYLFIGGDRRSIYSAEYLSADKLGLADDPTPNGTYTHIVLPMPVSRDGININAPLSPTPLSPEEILRYSAEGTKVLCGGRNGKIERLCKDNRLIFIDYSADESLTLKNAQLTAEGAIALLVQNSEKALYGSEILITGYGRVARCTALLLKAFHCNVTVCARRREQRTLTELDGMKSAPIECLTEICTKTDFILNTVPAPLFSDTVFSATKNGSLYLELASLPTEPYSSLAESNGIRYIHGGGLPGKFSPETAGKLIAETLPLLVSNPSD